MTSVSLLSQSVWRASMPDFVPSPFLPSLRQSSATAMASQKWPFHQRTDQCGVEAQMTRNRSPKWGRISSDHHTAPQAGAAWTPGHNRSTTRSFFPNAGVCSPIWPTLLGTAGNTVVAPDPPKTPTASTRQRPPRDAESRGQRCARSDRRGFSAC
jgi:hypothetical protein